MRLLTTTELLHVSGGTAADPSTPREKPTEALNGNGNAIGWCYGYGNLKEGENKHGVTADECGCCGGLS